MNEVLEKRKSGGRVPRGAESVHEGDWPLAPAGRADARRAGKWLRDNGFGVFDRYLVSDYLRARQTASHLHLPDARWRIEPFLRERGRGDEGILRDDFRSRFPSAAAKRRMNPFYWVPEGGGESMSDVCLRVGRVLDSLWEECDGKRVVAVCHEEVIWAIRMRLEKWRPETYNAIQQSTYGIPNGAIIQYTRAQVDGRLAPHMVRVRLIHGKPTRWLDVKHPTFSNDEIAEPHNVDVRRITFGDHK